VREQFYLDMMQKRLASDSSDMLNFNRAVIHDMLAVFGRQQAKYHECKDRLRQYACWCPEPCGPEHWGEDYCGHLAARSVGEKDDGSDETTA
jgi:hypothetical protein